MHTATLTFAAARAQLAIDRGTSAERRYDVDSCTPDSSDTFDHLRLVLDGQCTQAAPLVRGLRALLRHLKPGARVQMDATDLLMNKCVDAFSIVGLQPIESKVGNDALFLYRPDESGVQSKGLVSILIAAWNARYFERSLRSALAQTYRPLEIIVGDDSPTGAIEAITAKYASHPVPIHYERNPTRLMVRNNYERCFARARGEYIKFLNDDDLLEPRCAERLVAALVQAPSAVLATSARTLIDERDGPLHDIPATVPLLATDRLIDGQSLGNALLLLGLNFIGEPSTVLFRRSIAKLGDEPLFAFCGAEGRGVTDFVLWSKLLCRGDAVYLRERLSCFRVHAEQRQALQEVRERALRSIPELRARWIDLGLHLATPPNLLWTRALGAAGRFELDKVARFAAASDAADTLLHAWRTREHPFFRSLDTHVA